jgi:hypothetical protein
MTASDPAAGEAASSLRSEPDARGRGAGSPLARAGSTLVASLFRLACGLPIAAALVVFWFAVYYAIQTSSPLLQQDAWWFVEAWLVPWQEGSLGLADLWAKREGNHAQPLAALLFLANAKWLGLDFGMETVLGLALATGYCLLLLALARKYAPRPSALHAAWIAAAVVCIVFSVNSKDKLAWSLVTLFYMGHLLGLALLWTAARARSAPRPAVLFGAALVVCALVDTTGVLWSAAAAGVLVLTRPADAGYDARRVALGAAALLAGVVAYQLLFRLWAPTPAGPGVASPLGAMQVLAQQFEAAWYVAMPFGAALAHPSRLDQLLGEGQHDGIVLVLAACCALGHAWLWWVALRARTNAGFAAACGLALFGYATIVGILLQRVPEMGFSYLLQPRYGIFFDLLWIAPILGWACRPAQAEPRALRLGVAGFLVLPCALSLLWLDWAWTEIQWIRAWNGAMARDTWVLLQDPAEVPADCNPHVVICAWPQPVRERLLGALRRGDLNIASSRFRTAHDLDAVLREAERAARGDATLRR